MSAGQYLMILGRVGGDRDEVSACWCMKHSKERSFTIHAHAYATCVLTQPLRRLSCVHCVGGVRFRKGADFWRCVGDGAETGASWFVGTRVAEARVSELDDRSCLSVTMRRIFNKQHLLCLHISVAQHILLPVEKVQRAHHLRTIK